MWCGSRTDPRSSLACTTEAGVAGTPKSNGPVTRQGEFPGLLPRRESSLVDSASISFEALRTKSILEMSFLATEGGT